MDAAPDPGLVGIMLHLESSANARVLLAELPFESTYQSDGGSSNSTRIGIALPDDEGIDAAIGTLASAIDGLCGPAAEQWGLLQRRVVDVGLTNRPERVVCRFEVSPGSLAALGRLGITLVLTWYWPQAADSAGDASK